MTSDKRYPTFSLMYGSEYKSFVLLEAYEERLAEAEVLVKALEICINSWGDYVPNEQSYAYRALTNAREALKAWRRE